MTQSRNRRTSLPRHLRKSSFWGPVPENSRVEVTRHGTCSRARARARAAGGGGGEARGGSIDDFEGHTVADLRDMCRAVGVAVSGRKADLIARLIASDAIRLLDRIRD